jgi:hypothetical protein
MFEFNTATPDAFAQTCRRRSQPFRILRCGERFEYPSTIAAIFEACPILIRNICEIDQARWAFLL